MSPTPFGEAILKMYPGAKISADDEKSLDFLWQGLVAGARQWADGIWTVSVRDMRSSPLETAPGQSKDVQARDDVIPAIERLMSEVVKGTL